MKKLLALFFVVTLFMLTACSKSSSPSGPAGEFPVTFKSAALEDAVRDEIGKPSGTIFQSDVVSITNLHIYGEIIEDPSGIEYLTNLEELYICGSGSDLHDVTPISRLQNLKRLSLSRNVNLKNLESLANCPKLDFLRLNSCGLTNLKFLRSFKYLTTLEVIGNALTSLDGIQGLYKLETLYIGDCNGDNSITDISPIRNLTRLENFYAGYNEISDISVLLTMPGLQTDSSDICLESNPLNDEAYKVIERLEANGSDVDY